MALKVRTAVPLTLAVAALLTVVVAEVATAGHVRPKGASPISASLVPAFNQCSSPNRTHGAPLAAPSCNPPVHSSNSITIGEPTANGASANSVGFVLLKVLPGTVGPPEDSDVAIISSGTDVRCKAGTSTCGSANAQDGADYTGQLQGNATIRITDHDNGSPGPGGTDPATVVDLPFPVDANCTATASTAIGGTCSANTTANAVVPGSVKDTKRGIVEISQLTIMDGGPDGVVATLPNTVFAKQGIFIP
jgi:hypothetical protein